MVATCSENVLTVVVITQSEREIKKSFLINIIYKDRIFIGA